MPQIRVLFHMDVHYDNNNKGQACFINSTLYVLQHYYE
jgi:hypothetical protein